MVLLDTFEKSRECPLFGRYDPNRGFEGLYTTFAGVAAAIDQGL